LEYGKAYVWNFNVRRNLKFVWKFFYGPGPLVRILAHFDHAPPPPSRPCQCLWTGLQLCRRLHSVPPNRLCRTNFVNCLFPRSYLRADNVVVKSSFTSPLPLTLMPIYLYSALLFRHHRSVHRRCHRPDLPIAVQARESVCPRHLSTHSNYFELKPLAMMPDTCTSSGTIFIRDCSPSTTAILSYPGSKKHRTEASIGVPRMFNHAHSNNMINR
jgi:hypothetical protein